LLIGGTGGPKDIAVSSCELFDPAKGTFSATASLDMVRDGLASAVLADGRVLVAGGDDDVGGGTTESAVLYDPATGTFSPTGSLRTARIDAAAVRLNGGRVLVVGGFTEVGIMAPPQLGWFASAELYDPASRTFSPTGFMRWRRDDPVAVLLRDGRVLVTGGTDFDGNNLRTAEIYDPATGKFSPTGSMTTVRYLHTATLLRDGRVLVAGGDSPDPTSTTPKADFQSDAIASAELYQP
jgi:hypothetical protein